MFCKINFIAMGVSFKSHSRMVCFLITSNGLSRHSFKSSDPLKAINDLIYFACELIGGMELDQCLINSHKETAYS